MKLCSLTLGLLVAVGQVTAMGADLSDVCPTVAESYTYSDVDILDYESYCESPILSGVVALCLDARYPKSARKFWKKFGKSYYCTSAVLPNYDETLANATAFMVDPPTNISDIIYAPFIAPDDVFEPWYKTEFAYYDNIYLAQTYGWIIVASGCFVMVAAAILRFTDHFFHSSSKPTRLGTAVQRYITEPALFGKPHARRPRFLGLELSIPTRLESIFLFIYIVVNVVLCFTRFRLFAGNYYWPTTRAQFNRYVADRSGILSFAQFPFLFAFGGRNTIFLWLTGWSYQTFSVFHKWIARVCVWQAFLHTIMYTVISFNDGVAEYKADFKDPYWNWGVAAMTMGFCLVTFSIYSIRKMWYEIFVVTHIVFAISWLLGSYYHVKLLEDYEYLPWIWASVAVWGFDRTVRVLRLLTINLAINKRNHGGMTQISVLKDSVLKLTIPVPDAWRSSPGQYVFLYFPSFNFWQSHPFTILNVTTTDPSSIPVPDASVQVNKSGIAGISTTEVLRPSHTTSHQKYMTIVLRAHKGVTKRILEAALKNGGSISTKSLIEGPYGSSHNLSRYHKVILIAAGLGATAIVPFLMHLTTSTRSDTGLAMLRDQELVMHWIVQEESAVSWFSEDFTRALDAAEVHKESESTSSGGGGRVRIVVHVTRSSSPSSSPSFSSSSPDSRILLSDGRPDLKSLLASEINGSRNGDRVAVVSCGPGAVSDDCRDGVVGLLSTDREIRYFEESFTW